MARTPKQTKQEPLEVVLWKTADKLRKNIDAAEYKHVVLGLIFLKYISDTFEAHYNLLVSGEGEPYRVCRRVNILRDYSDEKTKLYPRN